MDETNQHPASGHEQSDVNVRSVSEFGIGLGLGVIATAFLMWFLLDQFAKHQAAHMVKPEVMEAANPQKEPPEPRLEAHPRIDLKDYLAAEDQLVTSYGWVDPEKGIVRIPVSRALDIVAKEGLK